MKLPSGMKYAPQEKGPPIRAPGGGFLENPKPKYSRIALCCNPVGPKL